jgi:hypothetical protein
MFRLVATMAEGAGLGCELSHRAEVMGLEKPEGDSASGAALMT